MNFQTIGWFWDHYSRDLLDLDPPYQRRSVWNQEYKDYFVDTVLNGFPAPAIFLYEDTNPDGTTRYSVVDGKQRLSTLFEFAENRFPVYERATLTRLRGKYFKDLDDRVKIEFWKYQFAVEFLPSSDEEVINNIFDRINRNVAKLTPQELRHARFEGVFITQAGNQAEWMFSSLPVSFPNIAQQSRKQMKDVEFTSQLLLLLEEGPHSYSQDDLDKAFSDRDPSWEQKDEVVSRFVLVVDFLKKLVHSSRGNTLVKSRLKNQADFYSLFGAIDDLLSNGVDLDAEIIAQKLEGFVRAVEDGDLRLSIPELGQYYEAARSASNDTGSRQMRMGILTRVLVGKLDIIH